MGRPWRAGAASFGYSEAARAGSLLAPQRTFSVLRRRRHEPLRNTHTPMRARTQCWAGAAATTTRAGTLCPRSILTARAPVHLGPTQTSTRRRYRINPMRSSLSIGSENFTPADRRFVPRPHVSFFLDTPYMCPYVTQAEFAKHARASRGLLRGRPRSCSIRRAIEWLPFLVDRGQNADIYPSP
jgi:hypothetical protein